MLYEVITLHAFGDQILYVLPFLGGVALAEEDLDVITGFGKSVVEARLILDPAWLLPCG